MQTIDLRRTVAGMGLLLMMFSLSARAAPREEPKADSQGMVNLNSASETELMELPGVGPAKAAAIVTWRKGHGQFKRVEDLTRVKGFGRKTLAKLKSYLSVTGPSTYREKGQRGDAKTTTSE